MVCTRLVCAAFLLVCSSAQADEVHLSQGQMLVGVATVHGDKLIVEMESGRVTVSLDDVSRIDRATTPLAEAEARDRKLRPDDIAGMIALANYCRDHDLYNKERELLSRILASAPDHAEARRRLGYVRATVDGRERWVERPKRESKHDEVDARQRRERMALERQEAEVALERTKLEQEKLRVQREAEERRDRENSPYTVRSPDLYGTGFYGGYGYAGYGYGPRPAMTPPRPAGNYGINGVRDFGDGNYALPGVRPPASYFPGPSTVSRPH